MYSLKNKYKKALVTGGAGFIGSHLVEELLKDGLEVISVDDYSGGKAENLEAFHQYDNFTEANCDITDYDKLKPLFEGVDIVFHEAVSKMTVCLKDPHRDLEINAKGTFNLLELSRDFGVKKFVHASTGSVYGEAHYYPTDEKHPLNPTSYYGVSKLAGEKYARVFSHLYGLNTTLLRYYHVYGPRQENSEVGGVVSIFARKAMENNPLSIFGDGSQLRSFTYVKDVVNINKLVAINPKTQGEAYNCASGARITIGELAERILSYFGKEQECINYHDWKLGDIKTFDVSNEKLKKLGFKFETEFDIGLKETISWTRQWLQAREGM
ncbi:MAG: SDR family NAD(P)-dependent oxidoreductase [Gammaproteobacteria bacterium]|nr:SDR family NAD(P)-dependent oxidoreductase [Gammaproteobacteria bacterium]